MSVLSRRDFLKLGAATASLLALERGYATLVDATELDKGGKNTSRTTGRLRESIPSTCSQCSAGCGILCFVEDGRLVKIEGNPKHPNNRGRLCSKGQAGINQLYDPDRVLYPMRRQGARGEGKWKRISWDEAYEEIAGRLKDLKSRGRTQEVIFHSGMDRSAGLIARFFMNYGTTNIFNEPNPCLVNKKIALHSAMGSEFDVNDVASTRYILNFGSNPYEAHSMHNSFVQRIVEGRVSGAKLVTFDVRLSNTAGRSDEWLPIMPGTDAAVALAMANVIIREGLHDKDFVDKWVNYPLDKLAAHLAQYTPEVAEKASGVKAADIVRIAREFALAKPATTISQFGVSSHANGCQTERSISLLNAITGNIDIRGGYCFPRTYNLADPEQSTMVRFTGNPASDFAGARVERTPRPHRSMQMIKEGVMKVGLYMTHMHNAPYSLADSHLTTEVLKNENFVPFFVAVDAYLSEGSSLADIILPDATYLERWEIESLPSYDLVPFISLRQPVVKPLGEAVQFTDMLSELAKRLGGMDQPSSLAHVSKVVTGVEGLVKAGGLENLKKQGAWVDPAAKPEYKSYEKAGFHTPSGKYEVYSQEFADRGLPSLPSYEPVGAHKSLGPDEFILVVYKQNVQTLSRTANCKWLSEIFHEDPLWINREVAEKRGIQRGDLVRLNTSLGSITARAALSQGIHPKVVAIAGSGGHWAYGRIAQSKQFSSADPDTKLIWWGKSGSQSANPNLIIPIASDTTTSQAARIDTVTRLAKA